MILAGHDGPVTSATWSPDGAQILTASNDRTARIWRFDAELLVQALREYTINQCLTPYQRRMHLLEDEAEATEKYQACERDRGREPAP